MSKKALIECFLFCRFVLIWLCFLLSYGWGFVVFIYKVDCKVKTDD